MDHPGSRSAKVVLLLLPLLVAGLALALFAGVPTASAAPAAPSDPCPPITYTMPNGTVFSEAQQRDVNGICPTGSQFNCMPPNNCTAQDIDTLEIGATPFGGVGCTTEGQPAKFNFTITTTLNASTRYDLGFYFSLDGQPVERPSQAGARCFNDYLNPIAAVASNLPSVNPYSSQGWASYPVIPLNVSSGYGSFRDENGPSGSPVSQQANVCGDAIKTDPAVVYKFHNAVVLLDCVPTTGTPGLISKINTCESWANNASQLPNCQSVSDLGPGTTSKCKCVDVPLKVPICVPPKLALTKDVNKAIAIPGTDLTYTIRVTNTSAVAATNVVVTDSLNSNLHLIPGGITTTAGTCSFTDPLVTCNLGPLAGTSPGPAGNATITIHVTLDSNPSPFTSTIINTAHATATAQPAGSTVTCSSADVEDPSEIPTPVSVASFKSTRSGNAVQFEWSTSAELGNVGFNIYVENNGNRQKINSKPITAQVRNSVLPQRYSFQAANVAGGKYWIEDVDVTGQGTMHGPFALGSAYGQPAQADPINWKAIGAEHAAKQNAGLAAAVKGAAAQTAAAALAAQPGAGPRVKAAFPPYDLKVDKTGLYRVTYEQLRAAGLDLKLVPAANIALTSQGVAVPIRVAGGSKFGPSSYIEFYGEALDTLYTSTNVYRLSVSPAVAARVDTNPSRAAGAAAAYYMETASVNRHQTYNPGSTSGNPWVDSELLAFQGAPQTWSLPVGVDHLAAGAAPASVTVNLIGSSDQVAGSDHHVVVAVKGSTVGDKKFDGAETASVTAQLPAGAIVDGNNSVDVTLPADSGAQWDMVHVTGYSLTYPRAFVARDGQLSFKAAGSAFRVSNLPSSKVVVYRVDGNTRTFLSGAQVVNDGAGYAVTFPGSAQAATYVVSAVEALAAPAMVPTRTAADLKSGQAQYLVISHADFLDGLKPLVDARRAQGLSVKAVNVDDVYAAFSGGVFDARAIRDYVKYAAANMGTQYVLLVGGDTYDYHNYSGQGSLSFIPSLYAGTGGLMQYTPVDSLYADVSGDGVPDLAIGRFPVRTGAELDALVAKTLDYAKNGAGYAQTGVLAADRQDYSTSFSADSDAFVRNLNSSWKFDKAYLDNMSVADARSALLGAINRGVSLASYVGHSGTNSWSFDSLLRASDVDSMSNAGKPTVVVQFGCWNTYYVEPGSNTLGHKFLLAGDRGAAAVFGPAALADATSDARLGQRLISRLTIPGKTLGQAIRDAKQDLASSNPWDKDAILGANLLGDPALVVQP